MRARLVESRELAPSVRHFVFEVPELKRFEFTPGQWVSFSASLNGTEITRAYSIASEPTLSNRFELCLNEVGDGLLSPFLFALAPGDSVDMRPPMGTFVLREPPRDAVFIATGTGVAPFRSMLRANLSRTCPQYVLLLGVRREAELLYSQEFEELGQRFPSFRFAPTLTRPAANWTGRQGRVQAHLEEIIAGRRDLEFYLCGLEAMVDDLRAILKGMGFDRKQIRYEKYD